MASTVRSLISDVWQFNQRRLSLHSVLIHEGSKVPFEHQMGRSKLYGGLLAPSNTPLSLMLKAGIDSDVLMFQAEGTVVPM